MVIGKASRVWLAAAALTCVMPGGAGAQGSAPADRVLAAVDVEVTQRVIDSDGSVPWPVQAPTVFTLQKLRTASGETKIVLDYHATGAPHTPSASHPLNDARVEYDPGTGRLSVFDRGGTRRNPRLALPQSRSSPMGSPGEWIESVVLTPAGAPARRVEMERGYGRPVGTAGRLNRYLRVHDDLAEEVLADPQWGVPVEISLSRRQTREARITFEYGSTPSGNLVRRSVRSERTLDPVTGRRSIVLMQFSNVRAEGW